MGQPLQGRTALDQGPLPGCRRQGRGNRRRGGDHQSAGAADEQQRQGAIDPLVPALAEGQRWHQHHQQGDQHHGRGVPAAEAVDEALDGGALALGLLDEVQDAVDGVVAGFGHHLKAQHPIGGQTAGGHLVPLTALHRDGLAGQGALVKGAEGVEQAGIGGQAGARGDFDDVTGAQLVGRHLVPHFALGSGADAQRLVGHQGHQGGDPCAGATGGVGLQVLPQHKEQQHHGRLGGLPEEEGAERRHRHQGLDGEGGAASGQCPRLAGHGPEPPQGGQGKQWLTDLARQQGRHPHQAGQRQRLPISGEHGHLWAAAFGAVVPGLHCPLEPESCSQHGGGDRVGGEAGGEIHHQLLGGEQHASLGDTFDPVDGRLYLAGAAGAVHPQHLPAVAATVAGRGGQRPLGHCSMGAMIMVVWMRRLAFGVIAPGGVFIPGSLVDPVRLVILGRLAGATAGRGDLVAAVAVVPVLMLMGGGLADGLDGGGMGMAAAGFAHDESLLSGSRPCGIAYV